MVCLSHTEGQGYDRVVGGMGGQSYDRVSEAWVGAEVYQGVFHRKGQGLQEAEGKAGMFQCCFTVTIPEKKQVSESERELLHLAFICQRKSITMGSFLQNLYFSLLLCTTAGG
jgi:hypothetical protein